MEKQLRSNPFTWDALGFLLFHFSPLMALFTHVTAFDWILCVFLYVIRMFFVTAGYHRYFSHRTYKTSRFFQFLLAFFAQTSLQKGALWWASHHRTHHRHSDTPDDPHSANIYGFWYAHVGWIVGKEFKPTNYDAIKDLTRYPELVWLNKNHVVPAFVMMLSVYLLGNIVNGGSITAWESGLSTLFIGFLLSTMILYHGTFTINSLMHKIGKVRYKTKDASKNSWVLAILTLGEGWHNNHHYYQSTARQGFYWWEVDISYYMIRLMGKLGLVWDIREVPHHVREANHIHSH